MNQSLSLITDKNKQEIGKTLNIFEKYLLSINTGKVTPNLLDNIYVEHDGKKMKISHIASIEVKKNIITISPWDKQYLKYIEKAVLNSSSKLLPRSKNQQILIEIAPLTKEDRLNIVKNLKKEAEQIKISIRQIRKNNNGLIKSHIKNNKLSSNLDKTYLKIIQKQVDEGVKKIEKYVEVNKENILKL